MAIIDVIQKKLNVQPDGIPTVVRLSQNENGRELVFDVENCEIPAGSTVTISGTKPDGNVYSLVGSITDNTVTFTEDIQMTAVGGQWDAKVIIVNGGNTVATGRVRFIVDPDPVDPDAVPSDSQLEGLVAQAEAYAETLLDRVQLLGSKTLYNVQNYGIMPDTGSDVYGDLFALITDTVSQTGGVIYFPAGRYIISDTLFIPANTMVVGEGYATEIYYDGTYHSFGVGLTNGGSNVGIMNIRVNTPNTDKLTSLGSTIGGIGFSTFDSDSISSAHPVAANVTRKNISNLFAKNIYSDCNYILQTETEATYTITNVIYDTIIAPKGLVSIAGDAIIDKVSINNISCAILRCGASSKVNVVVNVKNANVGRIISYGNDVSISGLAMRDAYEYDSLSSYPNTFVYISGFCAINNATITTSLAKYIFTKNNGKMLLANAHITSDNNSTVLMNYAVGDNYDNYYVNCIIETTKGVNIIGYGSNVSATIASTGDLRRISYAPKNFVTNDDLDNYTYEGVYVSTSSATSSSLSHCPVTGGGFVLEVLKRGNYVDQRIIYSNKIYIRGQSSSGFGSWYAFTGSAVT